MADPFDTKTKSMLKFLGVNVDEFLAMTPGQQKADQRRSKRAPANLEAGLKDADGEFVAVKDMPWIAEGLDVPWGDFKHGPIVVVRCKGCGAPVSLAFGSRIRQGIRSLVVPGLAWVVEPVAGYWECTRCHRAVPAIDERKTIDDWLKRNATKAKKSPVLRRV